MSSSGRRKFLERTGLTIGAFAVGSAGLGCASSGAPHMLAEVSGSIIQFDTAIPELTNPGDGVLLESILLEYPILLIKGADGNFTALSTECSHLGCTVRKEPSLIRCPCHDSAYDFRGLVLNGPAQTPLRRFTVILEGSMVHIQLQS